MPWILWRHLTLEFLKVLLATTALVCAVVAFGAVIRPAAEGLLGPAGILKYMGLATIPMLQYALPFAAGFAATLALHRFASDGEIQAMSVSGLSYRTILAPLAAFGLALGLGLFLLLHTVVPWFFDAMHRVIADDAATVVVAKLDSGGSFEAGNLIVHADRAALLPDRPPSGAAQRILLEGVAAIETDPALGAATEFVAQRAVVDVHRGAESLLLKVAMQDALVYRVADGTTVRMPQARPEAIAIASVRLRDPKAYGFADLEQAIAHPESTAIAEQARQGLDRALAVDAVREAVSARLVAGEAVRFEDEAGGRAYEVSSARLEASALMPAGAGGLVHLIESRDGVATREAWCTEIRLASVAAEHADGAIRVLWTLAPVVRGAVRAVTGGASVAPFARDLPNLVAAVPAQAVASDEWLAAAGSAHTKEAKTYLNAMTDVRLESLSYRWQRMAQAASVPLILLLGATLAIWRRQSLPLTIYLLAFLPAILDLVLTSSGQQWIRFGSPDAGLWLLWSGNALLATVLGCVWWAMARH